ncbi:MAG: hypothetical protein WCW01_02720 [Gammaproteobacteria bacterium]
MMSNGPTFYQGQYRRNPTPRASSQNFHSLAQCPFNSTSTTPSVVTAPPPSSTRLPSDASSSAQVPFPSSSCSAFSYSIVNEFRGLSGAGEGEIRPSNPPMQPTMPVNTATETLPLVTREDPSGPADATANASSPKATASEANIPPAAHKQCSCTIL